MLITRILSPSQEIAIGAMCKVKGFEKFISEIMALGTKEEMNKQLDAMEGGGESSGASEKENVIHQPTRKRKVARNNEGNPPTKKPKVTGKGRQKKVDKTPTRKTTTKTPGKILLVTVQHLHLHPKLRHYRLSHQLPSSPEAPALPPKQQTATPNLPTPEALPLNILLSQLNDMLLGHSISNQHEKIPNTFDFFETPHINRTY